MFTLLIETATERGMTALLRNDEILFHAPFPFGYQNTRNLLPEIAKGLKVSGLKAKDLSFIAVGIGPGSYTGMRVGAMAAKSFAFASGIPLVGVCTLQTLIPAQEGSFTVLLDARIGGAYAIQGSMSRSCATYQSEPQLIPIDRLENLLQNNDTIITTHALELKHKLAPRWPNLHWVETGPDPKQMHSVAFKKFLQQDYSVDGRLELLYLRKTQAEIERNAAILNLK